MGNVTDPGTNEISYAISDNALETLLKASEFCRQEAGFRCMNSHLLNNGVKKGWFTDLRGNEKDYFPGGMGESGKCACAITGTCALGFARTCQDYPYAGYEDNQTLIIDPDGPEVETARFPLRTTELLLWKQSVATKQVLVGVVRF